MKCCWEVTRHETEGKGNLHAVQARQADQSTGACVRAGSTDGGGVRKRYRGKVRRIKQNRPKGRQIVVIAMVERASKHADINQTVNEMTQRCHKQNYCTEYSMYPRCRAHPAAAPYIAPPEQECCIRSALLFATGDLIAERHRY